MSATKQTIKVRQALEVCIEHPTDSRATFAVSVTAPLALMTVCDTP